MHKSGAQKRKQNKLIEENSFKGRSLLFEMGITSNIEHSPSTISSEALNQIGDESAILPELSLIPDILDDDSDKSEILPDSNEQCIVRA